jgi:hypothetical protein
VVRVAGGDPVTWGRLAYVAGALGHPQLVHAFVMLAGMPVISGHGENTPPRPVAKKDSEPPLLLGPRIGQPFGEAGDRQIRRRGAINDCGNIRLPKATSSGFEPGGTGRPSTALPASGCIPSGGLRAVRLRSRAISAPTRFAIPSY